MLEGGQGFVSLHLQCQGRGAIVGRDGDCPVHEVDYWRQNHGLNLRHGGAVDIRAAGFLRGSLWRGGVER